MPNKSWGFVQLASIPYDSGLNYGGLLNLGPGTYAIVESAVYVDDEDEIDQSKIFVPIEKEDS